MLFNFEWQYNAFAYLFIENDMPIWIEVNIRNKLNYSNDEIIFFSSYYSVYIDKYFFLDVQAENESWKTVFIDRIYQKINLL